MRPLGFYAVFEQGEIIAITEGHKEARELSSTRAYVRFRSRIAAEEFAAWWTYERLTAVTPRDKLSTTTGPLAS